MNTERILPQDAVYGIASLAFTVAWNISIIGMVVAIATVLLVPRDALLAVIRDDRVLQRRDAFPTCVRWRDAVAPSRAGSPASSATPSLLQAVPGDALMAAYRATAPRLQPLIERVSVYGMLIRQRLPVLAGLLPGVGAMAWCAWGFGAHLYALSAADGTPLSTLSYRYWRMAMGACCAALFSFPFWPFPLSSWILLLPISGLMLTVAYTRRWRAA